METSSIAALRLGIDQVISFVGGIGKIKNYHLEFGIWTYLVEMEMGPEPGFGRIGCETAVLLPEVDILSL